MKSTGFIRKIDNLGRLIIPKPIRDELNIKSEDSFELFIGDDGSIIWKKCSFLINN